ncbi:hypothetical protein N657DRAFT_658182 [Parathielavia appendiculata]|uniref:DUF7779 domain-containing protein n=1 Tax=Parathielavia appendiculata TaxID=2587402 RepID=A0AAN6TV86_9PEZI|nr:hypothetical protein N657DRAFT_658182 [Parathielavia appendiculata]
MIPRVANPPSRRRPSQVFSEQYGVSRSPTNPVWQAAIEKYYGKLAKGGIKASMIDKDLWDVSGPDELIAQIEALVPIQAAQSNAWSKAMSRLQPIVLGLNDFVAVTAWAVGMNGKLDAVLGGSIRLIIKFAQPVLPDVNEMLESFQSSLPRIQKYEQELPMTESLEKALLDLYGEIIVFCAHVIAFFRNNPNVARNRNAWSKFSRDSTEVIANVRKYSRRVDEAADMIRLSKEIHTAETVAALREFQGLRIRSNNAKLPFFARNAELQTLKDALHPLRAVDIHGLGGIGKTQLALHFANTSMGIYEIAWTPAETQIKLVQAVSSLANKLGLADGASEDDYENVGKVRDWLNTAGKPQGSLIVTSRSPSQAAGRVTATIALASFLPEDGTDVLRSLTGLEPVNEEVKAAAGDVCRLIGGLLLAMVQISTSSANERRSLPSQSGQSRFRSFPPRQPHSQNLLVFFDPDEIPERLITNTKVKLQNPRLEFLFDEFDFGEAAVELNRTSLISRLSGSKALSMHRLVQFAVFLRQSNSDLVVNPDSAIRFLYFGFPNTWQQRGAHQGHGWASWETCGAVLPHVSWLMKLSERNKLKPSAPDQWAELICRAGTYLWEKEQPSLARTFFEYALKIDDITPGPPLLDLARLPAALAAYQQALAIREQLEGAASTGVADVCDSVACAYTELGDVDQATAYLDRATAIHHAYDPSNMSRTLAIRALACLRAGEAERSLDAIRECWRLQGLTQEQVEASRYPKHSGDVMMLARILCLQGRKAEAQELASRTIKMRRGVYGERGGPRVADSLFTAARMLEDGGETVLASRMMREVLEICGDAPEMRAHLARAFWFSAGMEAKMNGHEDDVAYLRQTARVARDGIEGREWPDEDADEGFMRLVSWMLW